MAGVRGTLRRALWGRGEKPTSQSVMGHGHCMKTRGWVLFCPEKVPKPRGSWVTEPAWRRLASERNCVLARCLGGEGAEGL